ncbi:MAG: DUF2971 domain-containing protein, partial [Gemmatimonadales bacterium]
MNSTNEADTAPQPSLSDRVLNGIVENLLAASRRPELTTLYHYTSAEGACGIVDSQSMWATDVRFLNDSSEWRYAVQLVRTVVGDPAISKHEDWGDLTDEFHALSKMTCHVTCFSANRNQLSQWRAYSGQGYALGFPWPYLATLAANLPLTGIFSPVVYDPALQRAALAKALSPLLAENPADSDADGLPHRVIFVGAVSVAATFFKDPAFSQEAEWRLAVIPPDNALQQQMPLQYRTVRGAVDPYRVLQLSSVTIPTTGI